MTNSQPADLNDLLAEYVHLAQEARQRALASQAGQATGWPPGYWFGVAFGFESAAIKLRQLEENQEHPARLLNGLFFLAGLYSSFLLVLVVLRPPRFEWLDWVLLLWPWGLITLLLISRWIEERRQTAAAPD